MALAIILAYRLIPARIRRVWSFGYSSSHLALANPTMGNLLHYGMPRFNLADGPNWETSPPSR